MQHVPLAHRVPYRNVRKDGVRPHRLLCFPPAGGVASTFRPWVKTAVSPLEICPIQYPGRERLYSEPNAASVHELASRIVDDVTPLLQSTYSLFGTSMGGLVAFEVVREIASRGLPAPSGLIVAASFPPQAKAPETPASTLGDQEFIEWVLELNLIPALREVPSELQPYVVSRLRHDLSLLDRYVPPTEAPSPKPNIFAITGRDDSIVGPHLMLGWQMWSKNYTCIEIPTGHHVMEKTGFDVLSQIQGHIVTNRSSHPPAVRREG